MGNKEQLGVNLKCFNVIHKLNFMILQVGHSPPSIS